MKLHPRFKVVQDARIEIAHAISKAIEAHALTFGELTSILAGQMELCAKYQIRRERHQGDSDKPGDLS